MSSYNPYSKYPDFGGGLQDFANQMIQFLMMNKYMGGGQTTTKPQTPPLPAQGKAGQAFTQNAVANTPGMGQDQLLQLLAQYLGGIKF